MKVESTLGRVGTGSGHTALDAERDADRTASDVAGTATGDEQRFRVLRTHNRSGLGSIFVALDRELRLPGGPDRNHEPFVDRSPNSHPGLGCNAGSD
jgi:hypothetical protein